jgi:hypothetical protein
VITNPEHKVFPLAAVVERGFDAWLWVDARVAAFPVVARRQLGHRLVDALLDALTLTTEASYTPRGHERLVLLGQANRRLAVARILLRGARERRHLSVAQHEHAMELLDDWGRQLGGWIKADRESGSRR